MKKIKTKDNAFILLLLITYAGLLTYTAWVGDDGLITFRSIENWFHGYGLVFNVGERVQTFTHPLWLFLQSLIYWVTLSFDPPFGLNRLYYGNILLSISLSLLIIVFFAFKVARSPQMAIVGVLILTLSKAYIDYSTSGLENPLSHFLSLYFFWIFLFKDRNNLHSIAELAFLAGLAVLNRVDTILIFFPVFVLLLLESSNKLKAILLILFGFLPVIVWELFSVFYYGSPFPNTAMAKLNTGIEKSVLVRQGIYYFINSLRLDLITLITIALSVTVSIFSKNLHRISVAAGIGLYLGYILYIGGDFMSGRFFSLPLLISVILLATFELKPSLLFGGYVLLILVFGLLPFVTTIERRPDYAKNREKDRDLLDSHLIADERLIYSERTGLLTAVRHTSAQVIYSQPDWQLSETTDREVQVVGTLGLNGLALGPDVHVIDEFGLADALIARMPLRDTERWDGIGWRIGHFPHSIPRGYKETISTGKNMIQDDEIAEYYDVLSFVISGPLWDKDRLIEIWNLNTGKYEYLIGRQ